MRPIRLPISAKVDLSGSDKRKRAGSCARKVRFRRQVLVLGKQFLIDQPGYVREQAQPLVFFHLEPTSYPVYVRAFEFFDQTRLALLLTAQISDDVGEILPIQVFLEAVWHERNR